MVSEEAEFGFGQPNQPVAAPGRANGTTANGTSAGAGSRIGPVRRNGQVLRLAGRSMRNGQPV